jgi:hypothetical protein
MLLGHIMPTVQRDDKSQDLLINISGHYDLLGSLGSRNLDALNVGHQDAPLEQRHIGRRLPVHRDPI